VILVVMGVEGSGKTTVGELLAQQLGWEFADGDGFHSAKNIQKMKQGIPLDDADRAGWLDAIHEAIEQWRARGKNVVVACSALKQSYRERIGIAPDVKLVFLKGSYELISERLRARRNHYAKSDLLASQFAALEEPQDAVTVDIAPPPEVIVGEVRRQLGL